MDHDICFIFTGGCKTVSMPGHSAPESFLSSVFLCHLWESCPSHNKVCSLSADAAEVPRMTVKAAGGGGVCTGFDYRCYQLALTPSPPSQYMQMRKPASFLKNIISHCRRGWEASGVGWGGRALITDALLYIA